MGNIIYIDFLSGNPYVDIAGICFGTDGCAKIIVDTIRKMEESENE
ncbi:MAG: hypothetical protein PUF03_06950 [Lachnospiraceae bacterium]|nr:hypothetical protein [Lachnospiraceae bacterium]